MSTKETKRRSHKNMEFKTCFLFTFITEFPNHFTDKNNKIKQAPKFHKYGILTISSQILLLWHLLHLF